MTIDNLYNGIIKEYKKAAADRKFEFNLIDEECVDIMLQDCYYCGVKPSNTRYNDNKTRWVMWNGIDRLDSSEDYTKENCVACCELCNKSKKDLPLDIFLEHIEKMALHLKDKGY